MILAKSPFSTCMNNHAKNHYIYPQFHWAVYQGLLYLETKLTLPSYTRVLWKTLICDKPDRARIVTQPLFQPSRPEVSSGQTESSHRLTATGLAKKNGDNYIPVG